MAFKRGGFDHLPYTSNPETDFHEMLQVGHNKGELLQMPLTGIKMAMHPIHGVVDVGEYPISELFIHRPDFYWQIGTVIIDLELDGPYHQHDPQYSRDQKINKLLVNSGVVLKREPFETMTKGNLKRIYKETCQLINKYVDEWRNLNGGRVY